MHFHRKVLKLPNHFYSIPIGYHRPYRAALMHMADEMRYFVVPSCLRDQITILNWTDRVR